MVDAESHLQLTGSQLAMSNYNFIRSNITHVLPKVAEIFIKQQEQHKQQNSKNGLIKSKVM